MREALTRGNTITKMPILCCTRTRTLETATNYISSEAVGPKKP